MSSGSCYLTGCSVPWATKSGAYRRSGRAFRVPFNLLTISIASLSHKFPSLIPCPYSNNLISLVTSV